MKKEYELSRLALADINGIWEYTAANRKVNNYYRKIFKAVDAICKNPEIGKSIDYVKKGSRLYLVESHVVVYSIGESLIYVDRVLHQSMQITDYLVK